MKRSSKCSLKFTTKHKQKELHVLFVEYARVVNAFIDLFWVSCPKKTELLKPVVDSVNSYFSARLRKVAAREAIDMVVAMKQRGGNKPVHTGKRMCLSETIANYKPSKTKHFDGWVELRCIGAKIAIALPIKLHKHFNKLSASMDLCKSIVLTPTYAMFTFSKEIEYPAAASKPLAIDSGIKALASCSDGTQLGTDIETHIKRVRRCTQSSKGQQTARRALKQRIDEVAKQVLQKGSDVVVTENLKNITNNTKVKRRLTKNMRCVLGTWNLRYWLSRLEQRCEANRVRFVSVPAYYTSQKCSKCGHTEKRNRSQEIFKCCNCAYTANADVQASMNILDLFLTGAYGTGCKDKFTIKVN